MSYKALSQAAVDQELRDRIAACINIQQPRQITNSRQHPLNEATAVQWACVSEEGWEAAYEADGADGITDEMILAAVQKHYPILEEKVGALETLASLDEAVAFLAAYMMEGI